MTAYDDVERLRRLLSIVQADMWRFTQGPLMDLGRDEEVKAQEIVNRLLPPIESGVRSLSDNLLILIGTVDRIRS